MHKKRLLSVVFSLAFLLFLAPDAFNNASQPPSGHTNAPGEGNCSSAGCHVGTPINNRAIFRIDINSRPATYDTSVTYNMFVSINSFPRYGFEVTAVDANGFRAGNFTLTSPSSTSLNTGANGRQYVGHNNAGSTSAWVFRWKPTAYVGPVTFYVAGLGANNDNTVNGDQTYLDTLVFMGQGQPANINANFTINNSTICVGDAVTFNNTSTGTITSHGWNFGAGAAPATASTAGPHTVTYSTTGTKTITLTVSDGTLTDTETKTVTVVSAPTANAGPDETICQGASVTLTATGGTTYNWSNGAGSGASVTVSPVTTTTYTVTATSGSCSATDQVVVFVSPGPTADAGINDTVCFGQTSTLTATGGVSYEWSTTDQTATISGVLPAPGSYPVYVTVTDANGCTDVDSARLVALALPVVTVADATTCGMGNATLDAGAGFASYLWSNSDATQTTTVTASGQYSVTVTDANGCSNADTATANVLSNLVVNVADAAICPGGNAVLDAGYPGATYEWSTNQTTQTITVTSAGTYSVTVTDGSCTGTDAATVTVATLPAVGAGPDATICAGEVANFGNIDSIAFTLVQLENFNSCALPTGWVTTALLGNSTWEVSIPSYGGGSGMNGSCLAHFNDDDAGEFAINRTALLSPPFDATQYSILLVNMDLHFRQLTLNPVTSFSVEVWDGVAYQNLATYTANQIGTTWASFVNRTFDLAPYKNPSLHLRFVYDDGGEWAWWAGIDNFLIGGIPANVYSWSPAAGIADPTSPLTTARPTTTTTYVLSATANGCTKTDTVVVTVNTSPVVTVTGIGGSYCESVNNNFPLTGTPNGGNFSGPGVTGSNFNPALAGVGTHNVIYSYFDGGLNCTGRDTITVTVHPIPVVSILSVNQYYCLDEPAFALQGSPAGGTFSGPGVSGGQFNPAVAGAGTHTITYNYTSPAGCANSTTITYNVIEFEPTITGLASNYCVSDNNPVTLTASPVGGVFSGPGISGTTFNPSLAGPGVHDIAYAYDSLLGYSIDTNFAHVVQSIPPSATTYTFTDDDEELSNPIPIGFTFNFFGQDYTQLLVSTNGFLTFDVAETDPAFASQLLPNGDAPNNVVALMWDDLELAGFQYFVSGSAPNRSLVIQYSAYHFFSNSRVLGQIVLREGTNEIELHCIGCQADDVDPEATQGIENADGTRAFVVPGRNVDDWSSTGRSVRFIPASCTFTAIEQVTVSGVSVDIADTTICDGQSVTITASGTGSYAWSNSETTPSITVSPSDTTVYVVTGTDGTCITTDTAVVNVNESIAASFVGLRDTICSGDLPITLVGSPVGGTFAGPGVSGTTFDPSQATVNALNTITYEVSNTFGCADTASFNVYVPLSPNAQFTLADSVYCLSALPVTLTASPAGGTFTGPGISNGIFVPYFAGVGVHQLIYRVAVVGGCDAVDTINITVHGLPTVTFDPVAQQYCAQSDSVQLVGTPSGGTFSGPGVNADYFNPAIAGIGGPYILSYTVVDANGCSSNNVQLTEVVSNPILQWVSLRGEYCINGDSVALQALPGGGTFSGDGVNGNYFNPAAASTNAPTISYNYTDGAGCDATLNAVLTIHDTLPISIDNLDTAYCVNEPLVVLSGFPFGGVFSGNGVVGNVFSPDTAGNGGPYLITYTHTDANGCVTSTSADTRIKPAANLLINGLAPEYCIEDDREVPIVLAPSGGTLLGSGITGTSFNPSNAGLGDYVISYEYTNSEGCTSYTWYTVNVRVCTGVDEVDANIQIGLYPNPTTGLLHFAVEGLDGQQVDVAVFSLQGQRILSQQFENVGGGNAMQLDLNGYATGTYLVQVQAGDYSSVHRVVVSR